MDFTEVARSYPQFGKSTWNILRRAESVAGSTIAGCDGEGSCGCRMESGLVARARIESRHRLHEVERQGRPSWQSKGAMGSQVGVQDAAALYGLLASRGVTTVESLLAQLREDVTEGWHEGYDGALTGVGEPDVMFQVSQSVMEGLQMQSPTLEIAPYLGIGRMLGTHRSPSGSERMAAVGSNSIGRRLMGHGGVVLGDGRDGEGGSQSEAAWMDSLGMLDPGFLDDPGLCEWSTANLAPGEHVCISLIDGCRVAKGTCTEIPWRSDEHGLALKCGCVGGDDKFKKQKRNRERANDAERQTDEELEGSWWTRFWREHKNKVLVAVGVIILVGIGVVVLGPAGGTAAREAAVYVLREAAKAALKKAG